GGIFILSTIDSGSLSSKIIGKRLEDFRRLREHLYFFNRKNISSFLRMHNFAIDSIVSIGNTFRLDHLLNRILLMYSKPWNINSRLGTVLMKFLSRISVYLNTHTKMIVFSRKRGDDSTLTTQRIRNDLMAMGENLDYYRYYMNYVKSEFLNKTVLELGSGTGNSSGIILQMGAKSVVGVERDPDLIEIARKKMHKEEFESKIEFIHMNIDENISELGKIIRERKVDVVFHFNFIEHIKKDIDLIKAIYEALPNGGRIISIVPAGSGIYSRFDETYRHYRRYDVCDLKYRFEPFRLKYYRECALLKNIGWRLNKNNPNMEFSKYWAIYHLVFFMIDKTIDTFFGKLLPFGATFVSVHDKIKHSVSNEDK
ncbi:MAG: class I SAM-dependent methyltransferase, partial [Deltaproteobacteria bacterium]|nr:class I SAM-dependent methyltransferase [Deltaproteobacteria bacterium]